MAIMTFNYDLSSAIYTESNTLVKGVLYERPLEHNVYKPVNISRPSYLISFTSYFCGSADFNEFILIKMPGALIFHCYFTKLNGFPHRMLSISNLALVGLYLVQFNVLNNLFNFTLIVQSVDHSMYDISGNDTVMAST